VRSGYCPGNRKKKTDAFPGFQPPQERDMSYIDIVDSGSGFYDNMEDDEYEEESSNFIDDEP
jgi:hypothetical protein